MEGDDGSMPRIEAPKRPVQMLALGERIRVVGRVEGVDRSQLDLDRAPPTASSEIETGVDRQSVQPGIEAVRITEPGQVAPCPDEALLNRILREVRIAEDQTGGCVQPPKGAIDQLGEGVMIASLCPVDELSSIHDRLDCRTT